MIKSLFIVTDRFEETKEIRKKIVKNFMSNVYGKIPDTAGSDPKHSGKEGHWLEKQMGIQPNASNEPDLLGYEMKNQTLNKITLGSWDPNYWVFRNSKYGITRDDFLKIFGKANPEKNNRMSWSGSPVPKIQGTNYFGMRTEILDDDSVSFVYSFSKDQRDDKGTIVPENLQVEDLEICRWNTSGMKNLRDKVENKFNQNGWFMCVKDGNGVYNGIVFGLPITFETFMDLFRKGTIYFDCGMYQGNQRNYCQWRTANTFWDSLIVEKYP